MTQMQAAGAVPELTLGWRMKMALEYGGMTREEMAELLGVNRATVSRWTNDQSPVRRGTLRLWALETGVDLGWLEHGNAPAAGGGGGGLYAIRDSNPEPADMTHSRPDLRVVGRVLCGEPAPAPAEEAA